MQFILLEISSGKDTSRPKLPFNFFMYLLNLIDFLPISAVPSYSFPNISLTTLLEPDKGYLKKKNHGSYTDIKINAKKHILKI